MLGPDPLGLVNKGSLLALGQQLPLRPKPLGDLCSGIVIILDTSIKRPKLLYFCDKKPT